MRALALAIDPLHGGPMSRMVKAMLEQYRGGSKAGKKGAAADRNAHLSDDRR